LSLSAAKLTSTWMLERYGTMAQQVLTDPWQQLLGGQETPKQQHMRLPALWHTLTCNGSFREHIALDDHGSGAGCSGRCSSEQAREASTDNHYLAWPSGDH